MKKLALSRRALGILLALLGPAMFGQIVQIQHEVSVLNIEIPVRVFKGDTFIDTLTINDFEVFEDGKPQTIDAVYLVKKTDILRMEGKTATAPPVGRLFALFFDMSDYLPELDTSLDYFFDKVVLPGDSLIVITPMKSYHLRADAMAQKPKDRVKEQLRGIVHRDILVGSSEYRNTLDDMRRILATPPSETKPLPIEMDKKLYDYALYLSKLESLRRVNEKGLLDFAAYLKDQPGQKFVYMFYQKELIPQFSPNLLMSLEFDNLDNPSTTMRFLELFELFNRDVGFNVDAVKKAYADSSISIHFLFVTKTPAVANSVSVFVNANSATAPGELTMVERSEDMYNAFDDMARATGGISNSSANAAAAFTRAVDASENYYLIYYKPKDYKADGTFHELAVRVKGGGYRVAHRAGYIAK